MSLKIINARIKNVARSGARFNAYVQETAVMCIEHAQAHGDANPALRLAQAMPAGVKVSLLVAWFGRHSPIGLDVKAGKCSLKPSTAKSYNPFNLDAARVNEWFINPEKPEGDEILITYEDLNDNVIKLCDRMQSKLDGGKVAAQDIETFTAKLQAIRLALVA